MDILQTEEGTHAATCVWFFLYIYIGTVVNNEDILFGVPSSEKLVLLWNLDTFENEMVLLKGLSLKFN